MVLPTRSRAWIWNCRRNWGQITPFFGYPPEIRKVIKTRGSFPNEEAAIKLLYLALEHVARKWTRPLADWKAALNQFAILMEGRVPIAALRCSICPLVPTGST